MVFAAVFAVVGLIPLVFDRAPRLWALGVAGLFVAAAVIVPSVLAPLNRVWTALGLVLHRIVGPIALGVVFFVVIAPMGFVFRLFGKDPLRLRFDSTSPSYWIDRKPPGPPPQSLRDQF